MTHAAPSDNPEAPLYAILGASGGLGRALSRHLADKGARLLLGGRDLSALESLADELAGVPVEVDARDFEQVEEFLAEAKELPWNLSGVVNCVGSMFLKPAHLTRFEDYESTIATNLTSAFATVRAAAKAMRRGGSVVLVASAVADIGLPNHEAIAAAKGGIAALARSAAATYAPRGLRFNAVAPGLVETPMTRGITSNEVALKASIAQHPVGRAGKPEEVASLIAWLLGRDATWVSGQVWGIDGGLARLKGKARI